MRFFWGAKRHHDGLGFQPLIDVRTWDLGRCPISAKLRADESSGFVSDLVPQGPFESVAKLRELRASSAQARRHPAPFSTAIFPHAKDSSGAASSTQRPPQGEMCNKRVRSKSPTELVPRRRRTAATCLACSSHCAGKSESRQVQFSSGSEVVAPAKTGMFREIRKP